MAKSQKGLMFFSLSLRFRALPHPFASLGSPAALNGVQETVRRAFHQPHAVCGRPFGTAALGQLPRWQRGPSALPGRRRALEPRRGHLQGAELQRPHPPRGVHPHQQVPALDRTRGAQLCQDLTHHWSRLGHVTPLVEEGVMGVVVQSWARPHVVRQNLLR